MFEVQKTLFELQKTLFKLHETLPTLYGKDTSGKAKQWSAAILLNGSVARYTVEYGQVDGKLQTTSRDFTEGKNIGKKNETTPLQQCTNTILLLGSFSFINASAWSSISFIFGPKKSSPLFMASSLDCCL